MVSNLGEETFSSHEMHGLLLGLAPPYRDRPGHDHPPEWETFLHETLRGERRDLRAQAVPQQDEGRAPVAELRHHVVGERMQ